jgi:hypothetical protein
MFYNPLVTNPAELALQFVDDIDIRSQLDIKEEETRLLAGLDHLTELANMHGIYLTRAGRALAIPVSFEADEPVDGSDFDSPMFVGRLVTYSIVKIGEIVEATSVRSLCLTFDEVTMWSHFDSLPKDQLLHVPVLAIDSMSLTAA